MRITTLDLRFCGTPGLIASYLVESAGELALIETGPGSTLPVLREALRAHGVDEKAIAKVFVTHIHLDHAGAAGWFAQQGATIYCHPHAARHLIDPSKLMSSARMVYGDQMDTLWGEMVPAPADKVIALQDGESVTHGDVRFTAWDTPGHARHHHAFVVDDICFTGDTAGLRLEGTNYLSVTAAPPQFDPEAYRVSVDRLLAAGFKTLYLTHFGPVQDVTAHLQAYRARIAEVHARVDAWVAAGWSEEQIRQHYREAEHAIALRDGLTAEQWQKCEDSNSTAMCADGVRLCCAKAREARALAA